MESPTASLTSSAGPAAAHAPAVLPSGASGGAQLHSLAGSSSMLTPPPGGRRGSWCGGSAAAAGAAHAHVSAARRVDMRALVATALEVASALRYLHDLVGGAARGQPCALSSTVSKWALPAFPSLRYLHGSARLLGCPR